MKTRIVLFLYLFFCISVQALDIQLKCIEQPVASFCPVEVLVVVSNTMEHAELYHEVTPEAINEYGTLSFYLLSGSCTNRIVKPVLNLLHTNRLFPRTELFQIEPFSVRTFSFLLGIDWDREQAVFTNAVNTVFCVLNTPSGKVESNPIQIVVQRIDDNVVNRNVAEMISDRRILCSMYDPEYIFCTHHAPNILATMNTYRERSPWIDVMIQKVFSRMQEEKRKRVEMGFLKADSPPSIPSYSSASE